MRTLTITLLAAINLALLVAVALPFFRHDNAIASVTPAGVLPLHLPPVDQSDAAQDKSATLLYVKADSVSHDADNQSDGKSIIDAKDAKDLEPVGELLPGTGRILGGSPNPNTEFAHQPSGKPLGILDPAQPLNLAAPTVSEEIPR